MKVEASDVNPRALWLVAAGLVAAVALIFLGLRAWMRVHAPAESPHVAAVPREFPAPQLQPDPTADLAKLRAAEQASLESYGWVDRERGVVRVPLDRAMDLTLQRGLPAREAPPK